MKAYSLNIGLTNRCNLGCVFCPVSKTKIKRQDMPMEMVERVIREADIEHHISLALFGESTLYEHLGEVIQMIKKKGIQSILYTNGLIVNEAMTGLDKIVFSIDAFDKDDYFRFKGFDGYDKVHENLKRFMAMKKDTHVTAQFASLDYRTPKDEIRKTLESIHADRIKLGRYITWGGEVKWRSTTARQGREAKPCIHIFKFINAASNGDVVMCCLDYNHSHIFGNVKNDNLMDIWNGDEFIKLRNKQTSGIFDKICLNCENESYYSPSK